MLLGWILIIIFFIMLFVYYQGQSPTPPWQALPELKQRQYDDALAPCQTSQDCTPNQACFHQKCYPKLNGGLYNCDNNFGKWVLVQIENRPFVSCQCRFPHLITQRYEGGQCDVELACAPHGRLHGVGTPNPYCVCDEGYKPVAGPACQKLTALEQQRLRQDCAHDEILASKLGQGSPVPCVKLPCTFDVISGMALDQAHFDEDRGCFCDPRFGNIGVRFPHPEYAAQVPGYNGCINLFQKEEFRKDVTLFTYFWYGDKSPISFIQYTNLDNVPLSHGFQIEELFPYDSMQHIFSKNDYDVQTRYCEHTSLLRKNNCYSAILPRHIIDCRDYRTLVHYALTDINTFNLLYQFPACHFDPHDPYVSYRGMYVSNPLHITWPRYEHFTRSNGLKMTVDPVTYQWLLDFAPPMDVQTEMARYKWEQHIPSIEANVMVVIEENEKRFIKDRVVQIGGTYQIRNAVPSTLSF